MLQLDKGISSIRCGKSPRRLSTNGLAHGSCSPPDRGTGVSPWQCGRDRQLASWWQAAAGGAPTSAGMGRKGEPKPLKTHALMAVQRPPVLSVDAPAGETRAAVIEDPSESEADWVPTEAVEPCGHLMSDERKAFVSLGSAFAAHDTVAHSARAKAVR
jgi:hypothetical protein